MTTPANSNETLPTKKPLPRIALIIIFEATMIGGCVVAMFTVPRSTPLHSFLIICASALALGNLLLFKNLNKLVDPNRKVNYTKLYVSLGITLVYWVLTLFWK